MFSKIATAAILASTACAAPTTKPDLSTFSLIAYGSGDWAVDNRTITANNYTFWIGKPTACACPDNIIDCPAKYPGTQTVFKGNNSLAIASPTSWQDLYVAVNGALSYEVLHSNTIPADGIAEPFVLNESAQTFSVPGDATYACSTGLEGEFQIMSAINSLQFPDCTEIYLRAVPATPNAYQYI